MSRLEDTEIVNITRLLLKIRWEIERTPFKDRILEHSYRRGKVQRKSRRWRLGRWVPHVGWPGKWPRAGQEHHFLSNGTRAGRCAMMVDFRGRQDGIRERWYQCAGFCL